ALSRLLNGEKFQLPGGPDYPMKDVFAARSEKLRRALWEAAPGRFGHALAQARKNRPLRLFIFPGCRPAREPGVMLGAGAGGQPMRAIDFPAANAVAAETAWKRPIDLDIGRYVPGERNGARSSPSR